ncbi:Clp protease N-terminal domain-containing protein [Rhodococcus sp. NPDC058505]|uniref:Clp protease N-terminal domain-containing protein n=1 Tax=Rhodococcus sp. NPDC058505 TaxID=3346531 RepID=UPI00365DF8FF
MFERFTGAARSAVVRAQGEAKGLASPRIGAEHVLLGVLVVEANSPLGQLCADTGLTHAAVRVHLVDGTADRPLGDVDAEALRSIGIDLDAVRVSIESSFGADALDGVDGVDERRGWFARRTGHVPFTAGAKKSIELSLREALARKDPAIGAEHLLLGLLRCADPAVIDEIAPHVEPAELRRRVIDLLDRAA